MEGAVQLLCHAFPMHPGVGIISGETMAGDEVSPKFLIKERSTLPYGQVTSCAWCGASIVQRGPWRRRYCNSRCRGKAWHRSKAMEGAVQLLKRAAGAGMTGRGAASRNTLPTANL